MDIQEIKLYKGKEQVTKKAKTLTTVKQLKTLVTYVNSSDEQLANKASWVLSHAMDLRNPLIPEILNDLIPIWKATSYKAVKRNTIRALAMSELNDNQLGLLIDECFASVSNPSEAIAVRAFSIDVLLQAYKKYPELGDEIVAVCRIGLIEASAGMKNKCTKVIEQINVN